MAVRSINRPGEWNFDVFDILRQKHQFLRTRIDPLEIIAEITELSDIQKEVIERACKNDGDWRGVDKLLDFIKKRGKQCFVSFLRALKSQGYDEVVDELIEYGRINRNFVFNDHRSDTLSNELRSTPIAGQTDSSNNDTQRNTAVATSHNSTAPISRHNLPSANHRQQYMYQGVAPSTTYMHPQDTEGRHISNAPVGYQTYSNNPHVGSSVNPNNGQGYIPALNNHHAGSNAVDMMQSVAPVMDVQKEQAATRQRTFQHFTVNQASVPEEIFGEGEDTNRRQQLSQQLNTPQGPGRVTSRERGSDTAGIRKNQEQITRIIDSFKDFNLEDVENATFEIWVERLNEEGKNILRSLGTKAKFSRKDVREMGNNESPGTFFMDKLADKGYTIGQLIQLLEICPDIQQMVLHDLDQVQNNLNGSSAEPGPIRSCQTEYNIPQDRDVSHSEERRLECQKLDSSEMSVCQYRDTQSRDENSSPDSSFEDNNKKPNVAKTPVENKEIDEENICEEGHNLNDDFNKSESEDGKIVESFDENSKRLVRNEVHNRPIEIHSDVENKLSEGNAAMAANSLNAVLRGKEDDGSDTYSNRREQFLSAANEIQSDCTRRTSEGNLEMNANRFNKNVITCAEDLSSMQLREETIDQYSAELTSDDDNITTGEHSSVLRSVKLAKDHHSVREVKEENYVEMDSPSTPTITTTPAVGDLNNSRSDNLLDNANIMKDVQKQMTFGDTISSEKSESGRSCQLQGQTTQPPDNSVQHTIRQKGTQPVEAEGDPDCKCSQKPPDLERQRFNLEASHQPNMGSYRDIQNSIPDRHSLQLIGAAADTSEDEVCDGHIESVIEQNMTQLSDQTFLKEHQL